MPISFNGSYTQTFDTLATSGTGVGWTNDGTLSGWSLFRQPAPGTAVATYEAGTGSGNAGAFYSFGAAAAADRALGGVGSGGTYFGSPSTGAIAGWIAFAATNATAATIDEVAVGFDGEQWRNGGNTTAQTMVMEYGFGDSFTAVSTWSAAGTAFNWSSVVNTATGAAVDGNAAGRVAGVGGTLGGLGWAAGTTLWLRWVERNDAGSDHGLAIDNFSLSAGSSPQPGVAVTQSGGTTTVTEGGAGDSYTVVLLAAPTADVVISLAANAQVTLGSSSLTFTPANWNLPQQVTVAAVDDSVVEGAHGSQVQHTVASADPAYNGMVVADVAVDIVDNDQPPPPPPVRIADIQGAAHRSPKVGQGVVEVPGKVTALAANGFYMQDPTPDADPATSDAIFVFTGSAPTVALGAAVKVSGTVSEFRPGNTPTNLTITQIGNSNSVQPLVITAWADAPAGDIQPLVLGVDRVAPTAVINGDGSVNVETGGDFEPAVDGIDFYESLEGMLVRVNNATVVSPTNSFGEIWVLPEGGAGATGLTARGGIGVSAGDFNPERLQLDNLLASQVFPQVDVGARLGQVTGVIDYAFGNYELRTLATPTVAQATTLQREVTALAPAADQLTVATFNVENLDPGDGAAKFNALAAAIVGHLKNPDVLSLEEVQDNSGATNNGVVAADQTLQLLIDAIAAAGGPTYAYRQIDPVNNSSGGEPGGNIRVAFLFNPARVGFVEGSLQNLSDTDLSDGDGFAASRKPLVGDFVFNGETVTLVANHFNSKGGDQPLFGPQQPPVLSSEAQRMQQADAVADYVAARVAADAGAQVLVLGDLNDFEFSAPLSLLESAGLSTLIETLPAAERYTYNFEGNAQALDHILASAAMVDRLNGFDVVHINSEFRDQVSDHDPLVARFVFAQPQVLVGGSGRDALVGGDGPDRITGGGGRDLIAGGLGRDTFVYQALADMTDLISDFSPGDDRLDISALMSAVGAAGQNPVQGGYLSTSVLQMPLVTGGSVPLATVVLFDADGTAGPDLARPLVVLTGVAVSDPLVLLGS